MISSSVSVRRGLQILVMGSFVRLIDSLNDAGY